MKLIVQIPCFNEEATLPRTVADIPREIPGVDVVEVLIVDDGSTDRTVEVAHACGVDHVIRNTGNRGLAFTFARALQASLERGADIVVNTDGDNQYEGASIPRLVAPIVERRADIVVGDRRTDRVDHFSPTKKTLQKLGSRVVRFLSGVEVRDAVSGFRAYSREAAIATNVLSQFSYTIETIIQAGVSGMKVVSVPVGTNPKTRESRLFKSIPSFIRKQLVTLVRAYVMYRSLRFFSGLGLVLTLLGAAPILRFLADYFVGAGGEGMVQSLVIGTALLITGVLSFALALIADAVAMNRRLLEAQLMATKRLELAAIANGTVRGLPAETPPVMPELPRTPEPA